LRKPDKFLKTLMKTSMNTDRIRDVMMISLLTMTATVIKIRVVKSGSTKMFMTITITKAKRIENSINKNNLEISINTWHQRVPSPRKRRSSSNKKHQ